MLQDVSLNMDLVGRLGVTQSDVYSHLVVKLSAVEYLCNISQRCNNIINQTLEKKNRQNSIYQNVEI